MLNIIVRLFVDDAFVMSFLIVGIISVFSNFVSSKLTQGRIHNSAIAIFLGLVLAYIGGKFSGGSKGISDMSVFAGLGILGSSSLRDFAIVATSFGAKISEIKKCGVVGIVSLFIGVFTAFVIGAFIAIAFGYTDVVSVSTIAAGTVTFVVGPVTGAALGAESTVIAISIACGLVKSVAAMLLTPVVAKKIGLASPRAAMIFGGLIGTTSGTTAGLAATDTSLVPYGAMTSTFYTGLGCLLCPTVLYSIVRLILG
ncbi:MAG: malonate transporter subunit MadM [Clostridia bacterium]|nr:malonate transporter subunit MadM [Clostridia bacterium]